MNAAGRGPRGGFGVDFYPTPSWAVRALLGAVDLPLGVWLEPNIGSAAIVRAVEHGNHRATRRWLACDIRDEVRGAPYVEPDDLRVGDFLDPATLAGLPQPDVIIGNPPYIQALAMVARCLDVAAGRAWVAMLLRLGFLESEERAAFLRAHPPDVYPLSRRPSFTGEGTDSAAYAWFVWPPGGPRRVGCAPIGVPTGQTSLLDLLPTAPPAPKPDRSPSPLPSDWTPDSKTRRLLEGQGLNAERIALEIAVYHEAMEGKTSARWTSAAFLKWSNARRKSAEVRA